MVGLGHLWSAQVRVGSVWVRFMVGLGQFGTVHGRVGSVWVGSWSVWVSLGRFMVGLGQFGSVHGRVGSVHGKFGLV